MRAPLGALPGALRIAAVGASSQPMLDAMVAEGLVHTVSGANHQQRIGTCLEYATGLGAVRMIGSRANSDAHAPVPSRFHRATSRARSDHAALGLRLR
jgi:hypothetical protein